MAGELFILIFILATTAVCVHVIDKTMTYTVSETLESANLITRDFC